MIKLITGIAGDPPDHRQCDWPGCARMSMIRLITSMSVIAPIARC
jgi:hypothetical protein